MEDSLPQPQPAEVEDVNTATSNLKAQIDEISQETSFLKKYFVLRKRCEQIQQVILVFTTNI